MIKIAHSQPSSHNNAAIHNKNKSIFNSNRDTMMDYFQKGYVAVQYVNSNSSEDRKGVVALRKIRYQIRSDYAHDYIGPFVGKFKGKEISKSVVLSSDPESLRYVVEIAKDKYLDLSGSVYGRINHAPNTSELCNLVAINEILYQTKTIRQGQELMYDYGCSYWVYQITGHDEDEWKLKNPESMSIWEKMHSQVLDYGPFLKIKKHKTISNEVLHQVENLLEEME